MQLLTIRASDVALYAAVFAFTMGLSALAYTHLPRWLWFSERFSPEGYADREKVRRIRQFMAWSAVVALVIAVVAALVSRV